MTFSSHSREVRSQPLATLPPGSIPGTLNIKADAASPRLILIDYSPTQATRLPLHQPQDCVPYLDSESVSWLDVQGLGSEETLRQLGQIFKLHALVLETVVNVPQRPKVEDYGNQLLVVTQMSTLVSNPSRTAGNSGATVSPLPQLMIEQVSFILQKNEPADDSGRTPA